MQAKREQWSGFSKTTQASRLVFQAESGVNINMARRYGQGKGGRRVVDWRENFLSRRLLGPVHISPNVRLFGQFCRLPR